jgi:hypothetical protein
MRSLMICTKIKKNEKGRACSAYMRERSIQGFGREPEGKRPFGRPRSRRADNNKMDLQEVGCGGKDWIKLAEDRDSGRHLRMQ